MRDTPELGPLVFGLILGGLIGFAISGIAHNSAMDQHRAEAVDRGYAEWVVDSRGHAKWQWKEPKP